MRPVCPRRRACSLAAVRVLIQARACLFEDSPRENRIFFSASWASLSHALRAPLGSLEALAFPHGDGSSFRCSSGSSDSCACRCGICQSLLFWRNLRAAVCFAIVGDHPACRLAVCLWPHVALSAASKRSLSMAFDSEFVAAPRPIPDFFASLYAAVASLTPFPVVLSFRDASAPGFSPSMASSSLVYASAVSVSSPLMRAEVTARILMLTLSWGGAWRSHPEVRFDVKVEDDSSVVGSVEGVLLTHLQVVSGEFCSYERRRDEDVVYPCRSVPFVVRRGAGGLFVLRPG